MITGVDTSFCCSLHVDTRPHEGILCYLIAHLVTDSALIMTWCVHRIYCARSAILDGETAEVEFIDAQVFGCLTP